MTFLKSFLAAATLVASGTPVLAASATRTPAQDVNSADVRNTPGLSPDAHLLFNGWGLTPAGQHLPMSDTALKLVVAPDKKRLLAVHGGFNQHGVTVFDIVTRKQTQFLPLSRSWNGLVFSVDGKQCFVSGGRRGRSTYLPTPMAR